MPEGVSWFNAEWPVLPRLTQVINVERPGISAYVTCSRDGTIKFWNKGTFAHYRTIRHLDAMKAAYEIIIMVNECGRLGLVIISYFVYKFQLDWSTLSTQQTLTIKMIRAGGVNRFRSSTLTTTFSQRLGAIYIYIYTVDEIVAQVGINHLFSCLIESSCGKGGRCDTTTPIRFVRNATDNSNACRPPFIPCFFGNLTCPF